MKYICTCVCNEMYLEIKYMTVYMCVCTYMNIDRKLKARKSRGSNVYIILYTLLVVLIFI